MGYRRDLAEIHHLGFSTPSPARARGLRALVRAQAPRGALIADLGCGSGVWAAALLRAGYRVFGVDQSKEMVRLAERTAPEGTFVEASVFEVTLPKVAGVTALGEVFNYLFDPRGSARALERAFQRIYAALEPGGFFLFDVAIPGRVPGGVRRGFTEGDGWICLFESVENTSRRTLSRRVTTFRRAGQAWRRSDETHALRLYPLEVVEAALVRAGFLVRPSPVPPTGLSGCPELLALKPSSASSSAPRARPSSSSQRARPSSARRRRAP